VKTISPGGIKSDFMGKAQMVEDKHYAEMFQKMLAMFRDALPGSKPEQIAEVVYEAATDGKEQLRYVAGSGCNRNLSAPWGCWKRKCSIAKLMNQFLNAEAK